MTGVRWAPGPHHALVRADTIVLVADLVSRSDVLRIWDQLEQPGAVEGLGSVLDVFAEVTGLGLRSLPDFAVVVLDETGVHVAVRGCFDMEVVHVGEAIDTLRGREVSTWVERNFEVGSLAQVRLGDFPADDEGLPLVAGVVPVAGVRLTLAVGAAPAPSRAPARAVPVPQTEPAVEPAAAAPEPEPEPEPEPGREVAADAMATPAPPEQAPSEPPGAETLAETELEPDPEPHPSAPSEPDAAVDVPPAVSEPPGPAPSGRFASLLSEHTVMHHVEEAAVRPAEPGQPVDPSTPASREPAAAPGPAREAPDAPALGSAPVTTPATPAAPATTPSTPTRPIPTTAPAPSPPSFISAVPGAGRPTPAPGGHPGTRPGGPPASQASGADGSDVEYHDGHTALAAPDSTVLDAYVAQSAASGTDLMVLGVSCPAGHGNPTHRTTCRVCDQPLDGESVRMPRPGLGWLHTSAGESIELVQNVLAGRDPRASRIQGPVLPRLLPLPHGHVSGTHLEIRLEGWSVLVADLRSTNGTFLQRAGQPTLRISEAPQLLMSGDVVQLGHGVDLRFEELP